MQDYTVNILLATYNGGRFLREQLNSLAQQTYQSWTLLISDDGSSDNTLSIVEAFSREISQPLEVIQGPQRGAAHNFFHLLQQTNNTRRNQLFAFCDQDDVWLPNKLAEAVSWHQRSENQQGRLYCSATQYVDEHLQVLRPSPSLKRTPSFGNALVQNIASGNTMVFDGQVLLGLSRIKAEHSVWHDWTTYLVATALGGQVFLNDSPSTLYRQHSKNVIGSNHGIKAQLRRLIPLWRGRYRQWCDANVAAMADLGDLMSQASRQCLEDFQQIRHSPYLHQRLRLLSNTNIRRQTLSANLSLFMAVALQKI